MLPTSLPLVIGPLNSFLEPSRLLREYKACATISALTCTRLPLTLRDTSLMTETQTHILLNRNTLEHGVSYPLGHDTHQPLTITFFIFFIFIFLYILSLNQTNLFIFYFTEFLEPDRLHRGSVYREQSKQPGHLPQSDHDNVQQKKVR